MHWRKWTVKFKVGEREFYYCLFTDLDEARHARPNRPAVRTAGGP
jgi:hypothetical protein